MPVSSPRTNRKPSRVKGRKSRTAARTTRIARTARAARLSHVVIDDSPPAKVRRAKTRSRAKAESTLIRRTGKDYVTLPSWRDLDKITNGRVVQPKSHPFDSISTARIALMILIGAVAVTAYVGHVHATQGTLRQMHQLRTENAALRLEYGSVKGEYDRMTGPAVIRRQARELGLIETTSYGETLTVEN